MNHKIYMCYASKDKQEAEKMVEILEREGFLCWIAPRNIPEGGDWAVEITKAIEKAKYFVLLYSVNSANSLGILSEVRFAVDKGVSILPVRIDDSSVRKSLECYLDALRWSNCELLPIDEAAKRLCITLRDREDGLTFII